MLVYAHLIGVDWTVSQADHRPRVGLPWPRDRKKDTVLTKYTQSFRVFIMSIQQLMYQYQPPPPAKKKKTLKAYQREKIVRYNAGNCSLIFSYAETGFRNTINRPINQLPRPSFQSVSTLLSFDSYSFWISTQKPDDGDQIEPPSFFIRALGLDEYVILTWLLSNPPSDLVLQHIRRDQ